MIRPAWHVVDHILPSGGHMVKCGRVLTGALLVATETPRQDEVCLPCRRYSVRLMPRYIRRDLEPRQ